MKILVTGGTGFIGAWVISRLLNCGHNVRIFDMMRSLIQTIGSVSV